MRRVTRQRARMRIDARIVRGDLVDEDVELVSGLEDGHPIPLPQRAQTQCEGLSGREAGDLPAL